MDSLASLLSNLYWAASRIRDYASRDTTTNDPCHNWPIAPRRHPHRLPCPPVRALVRWRATPEMFSEVAGDTLKVAAAHASPIAKSRAPRRMAQVSTSYRRKNLDTRGNGQLV